MRAARLTVLASVSAFALFGGAFACGQVTRDQSVLAEPAGSGGMSIVPAEASAPPTWPYPFQMAGCQGAPPEAMSANSVEGGAVHCVTRAELAQSDTLPKLLVDGGVATLGSDTAWRCPELAEINFSRGCECCSETALCGPVVERAPFDAGLPPDAADGEQLCCYYTVVVCLV